MPFYDDEDYDDPRYNDDDAYTPSDAHHDAVEALIKPILVRMVEDELAARIAIIQAANPARIIDADEEDEMRLGLMEELRDEAEAEAEANMDSGPCCNDYDCPCGNSAGPPIPRNMQGRYRASQDY